MRKIVICTLEGVYGRTIVGNFINNNNLIITGIVISHRVYGKSGSMLASINVLKKTGFKYYWYLIKTSTPLTSLFFPKHKKPIKKIVKPLGIPVHETNNINNKQGIGFIKKCNPDIVITFYFNQIIKSETLKLPYLFVNFHPSLLPKYRGIDPILQQIVHGEEKIGITLHYIDKNIDTGKVITQATFTWGQFSSFYDISDYIILNGIKMLVNYLINDYANTGQAQDKVVEASYFSWPKKYEVEKLNTMGVSL